MLTSLTIVYIDDIVISMIGTTQPGDGSGYVFQVQTLNAFSDPGTDNYSYPIPPSITSVVG